MFSLSAFLYIILLDFCFFYYNFAKIVVTFAFTYRWLFPLSFRKTTDRTFVARCEFFIDNKIIRGDVFTVVVHICALCCVYVYFVFPLPILF